MSHRARTPAVVRTLLVAFALAFLAGCSTNSAINARPDQAILRDPAGVTLPTRRCANYFLVQARLNGKGPFNLLLDTGASQTVVSTRVAEMLRDDARAVDMYAEGAQGKRQDVRSIVSIRRLQVGDAELRGLEAIALDLSRIQATLGAGVDGILGYPAFRDVLLVVDYPASAVRVSKGDLPPADGRAIVALTSRDRPTVDVRVGSRSRSFLIDTGKAGGFSCCDFDRLGFANPPATIAMGVAVGGSYELTSGRLETDLTLGDVVFRRPVVEKSESFDLIGAEALKTFVVTFDQRNRRIRLHTAGERVITFSPVRGIGVGFDFSEGKWGIARVFPGQPAEAVGILPGDSVIRLGGKRLRELACTRPIDLFDTGDAVDLTVIRQRRRLDFRVPIMTVVP
ncbi:MAG TPA: aspartyl protease family protein [Phycisphaerales bacterium]|nr:aspartyl protease family protein [Phycisphaerales bacterium]